MTARINHSVSLTRKESLSRKELRAQRRTAFNNQETRQKIGSSTSDAGGFQSTKFSFVNLFRNTPRIQTDNTGKRAELRKQFDGKRETGAGGFQKTTICSIPSDRSLGNSSAKLAIEYTILNPGSDIGTISDSSSSRSPSPEPSQAEREEIQFIEIDNPTPPPNSSKEFTIDSTGLGALSFFYGIGSRLSALFSPNKSDANKTTGSETDTATSTPSSEKIQAQPYPPEISTQTAAATSPTPPRASRLSTALNSFRAWFGNSRNPINKSEDSATDPETLTLSTISPTSTALSSPAIDRKSLSEYDQTEPLYSHTIAPTPHTPPEITDYTETSLTANIVWDYARSIYYNGKSGKNLDINMDNVLRGPFRYAYSISHNFLSVRDTETNSLKRMIDLQNSTYINGPIGRTHENLEVYLNQVTIQSSMV